MNGRHIAQVDRPDKRKFRITEDGMAVLRDWLDRVEPIEPEDRDGILLKLFFGAFGNPEAGRLQLLDFRGRVGQRLDTYYEIERTFDGEGGTPELQRLQSLRLGIALMQATLDWADETLKTLEPARPTGGRPSSALGRTVARRLRRSQPRSSQPCARGSIWAGSLVPAPIWATTPRA